MSFTPPRRGGLPRLSVAVFFVLAAAWCGGSPPRATAAAADSFSATVFTSFKPLGTRGAIAAQADVLLSWVDALGDSLDRIVLLVVVVDVDDDPDSDAVGAAHHPMLAGYLECKALVDRAAGRPIVRIDRRVDSNFLRVPLFNSMLERALFAPTSVSILINADIHLQGDVVAAIQEVRRHFPSWLAVAARWDVPRGGAASSGALDRVGGGFRAARASSSPSSSAILHTFGGVDTFIMSTGGPPLCETPTPPFVFGRGVYDNWIVHQCQSDGLRAVVDITEAIFSYHVAHGYDHLSSNDGGGGGGGARRNHAPTAGANTWSTKRNSLWETYLNSYLGTSRGTYQMGLGTTRHAGWRLSRCVRPSDASDYLCMRKLERPGACPCEYNSWVSTSTQSEVDMDAGPGRKIGCGWAPKLQGSLDAPYRNADAPMHHTLDELLRVRASPQRVVVLSVATHQYRDLAMNFVCNMRRLGVSNFIVAALDLDVFDHLYARGAPVFLHKQAQHLRDANCSYATPCFKEVTKMKSTLVLSLLETGYTVLWTDVDVVWFQNVVPVMMRLLRLERARLGSGGGNESPRQDVLLIQSDEPLASNDANARVNSGFYLASPTRGVIDAFRRITRHAAASVDTTEQPSFYHVLCGKRGRYAKRGGDPDRCVRPSSTLTTRFLNREDFPNGGYYAARWDDPPMGGVYDGYGGYVDHQQSDEASHDEDGPPPDDDGVPGPRRRPYIVHNNWIAGIAKKWARLKKAGFTFYVPHSSMCRWSWMERVRAT